MIEKRIESRQSHIDEVAGLLIIYMIVYHIFQWCDMPEMNHSYLMQPLSFFMFWFFYKSGMLYKGKTPKETLLGGGKLMIPYFIFGAIGHGITCIQLLMQGDDIWYHYILSPIKCILIQGAPIGNLALWFLPSLFAVQLLYSLMRKRMRDEWIILIGLTIAYSVFIFEIKRPFYLGNIPLGLAVYSFGHLLKTKQYTRLIFIVALLLYFSILFMHPYSLDFRANRISNGYYLIAVISSLAGCILINNIFKRKKVHINFLEWIGNNSMNFYVIHWLVLYACSLIIDDTGWGLFTIMITSCFIILPIISVLYKKIIQ